MLRFALVFRRQQHHARLSRVAHAWALHLSATEQGAGGIGGLAIISAAASVLNPTAATYVPLYDGHGNVVSLRDTSTNELAAYTYGPYGETTAAIGSRWASNPFRFSTKFTDAESGLVYYGYRYYLPSVGRWAGRDPVEESGGLNLCAFVQNAPADSMDAFGEYELDFHYYIIYYIFRSKYYTPQEADIVSHASQAVDNDEATDPVRLGILGVGALSKAAIDPRNAAQWRVVAAYAFDTLRDFHFWDSSTSTATTQNPPALRARIEGYLAADDLANAGRWLHTYADTWLHEGFTAFPVAAINRRGLNTAMAILARYTGHVDTALGGTAPDKPYLDVPQAMQAATQIWMLIPSKCDCNSADATSAGVVVRDLYNMLRYPAESEVHRSDLDASIIKGRFGERPHYNH